MIEKPKTNKAKSHYRHNGTQDHGDAGQRKGRETIGHWEEKWERRGPENADKAYLKEIIRDGLDDYYSHMSPKELEQEADRILSETESEENVDYFLLSDRKPYAYGYHDSSDGRYFEADYSYGERLKTLEATLKSLKNQLADMPGLSDDDRFNQQQFTVEAEIDEVITEIRELLGESDYPEATRGISSRRDIKNRNARAATLDDYDEDDFGDDNTAVGARVKIVR